MNVCSPSRERSFIALTTFNGIGHKGTVAVPKTASKGNPPERVSAIFG